MQPSHSPSRPIRWTQPKAWMMAIVMHCRRHGAITPTELSDVVRHWSLTVTQDHLLDRLRRAHFDVRLDVDARNNRRYFISQQDFS